MFNISEKAPLWLAGILCVIHALMSFAPGAFKSLVYSLALLVPLHIEGVTIPRQAFSLIGHGFLHGGWTHVLVNSGMMVAFGVITIRGIRAFLRTRQNPGSASVIFMLIFLAGVVIGGLAQWAWWAVAQSFGEGGLQSALGASGGASALFATAAWAMGGRGQMLRFGFGWLMINVVMVVAEPIMGFGIAWAAHLGGYLAGMLLAPYCVKASSSGPSITR